MQRRLTTILAADIAGFSRLVDGDEEETLSAQRAHRTELIDPLLKNHNGRIANTAGDSLLVEFPSAVEAVRLAMAVQEGLLARNADVPQNRRIEYRIGINVGDVVAEGDDLLGDGVNIAARLEALAPPGGIVLSRTARDQVRDRLELHLADLGEISVKNISRPVRAFQVLRDGETPVVLSTGQVRRKPVLIAAAVAVVALIASAVYLQLPGPDAGRNDVQSAGLTLPEKPSIAVLPFQDISEGNPQQWFGDGMAEDIITDLSKLSSLFVIARNSSFQYRGGGHDLRQVGRELGVAYLLEGSVRRAGDALRINAQLIDAATGGHVWAERYDGAAGDVFALQDRVTGAIVKSLALALTETETQAIAKPKSEIPAAHDAYLQGLDHLRRRTPEDYAKAKRWLDKALDLDQAYADALGARANLYLDANQRGWYSAVGIKGKPDAIAALRAALKHPSAKAHETEAELLFEKPDIEAAWQAVERGLTLDPNDADLHVMAAVVQAGLGNQDRAMSLIERAMRLNPLYPAGYLKELGTIRFIAGEVEAALDTFNRAYSRNPADWSVNVRRAAAFAELGRLDEAAADLAVARDNWPKRWGAQFTAPVIAWYWGRGFGRAYVDRLKRAFLAAGVPALPEGYDIRHENRLNKEAYLALYGAGIRVIGKCCGGGEWMMDTTADGEQQSYWNGQPDFTGTRILYPDGSNENRRHDPFRANSYCETYRNPSGSNETLDAYLGVCAHGIFPYGVFPLPK